jgi:heme/copper-type cytochrome/quinol oxidase subunit 3
VLGVALTGCMTFLLICSSVTMVKALAAIQEGDQQRLVRFLGLTILGGLTFLGLQAYEWTHIIHEGLTLSGNPWGAAQFGTTFFMTTGFHGCHVCRRGYLSASDRRARGVLPRTTTVETAGLYWHFVDLIWILVFTFIYLI